MKTLFKYATYLRDEKGEVIEDSWALISVTPSNVLEAYFDKTENILVVVMDSSKEYKQFLPLVTKAGYKRNSKGAVIEQLQEVQRYFQIEMRKEDEIALFLDTFCINP